MSEEAEVQAPAPSREEAITAAEAAVDAEVLTTEDVAGTKPAPAEAKGDRELVAPSIREFIRAQATPAEPVGLEKEVRDLRAALDSLATTGAAPAELSESQQVLAKLAELEQRESARLTADQEAAAEEAYNQRMRGFREGVVANVTDTERFPGLVALEQQETVVNALLQRTEEGVETSEVEIASEVESGLREVYETLAKVYGTPAPSEDQPPASEPKQTLTPGLSTTLEAADVEKMSRAERIEYLWAKTQQQS